MANKCKTLKLIPAITISHENIGKRVNPVLKAAAGDPRSAQEEEVAVQSNVVQTFHVDPGIPLPIGDPRLQADQVVNRSLDTDTWVILITDPPSYHHRAPPLGTGSP